MLGENVTTCVQGKCRYSQTTCCYECDYRIRDCCGVRCFDHECRTEAIKERLYRNKNEPREKG